MNTSDPPLPISVIVTGATGMTGAEVVRRCIDDPEIERITAIVRRPLEIRHEKLRTLVHGDFLDYSAILPELRGHDAVLWCLGVSQNEVNAADYERITLDYTIAGALAMKSVNPDLRFCFLSGSGADSSERSRIRFARIKGRTENRLRTLGLRDVVSFRPAYIYPDVPRPSAKLPERLLARLAPLIFRFLPRIIIRSGDLARAMIHVAKHGAGKAILENVDIQKMGA